jgi:hypothetical protein
MAIGDLKLSLMTFPQRWADGAIAFRVLLIPANNPLKPLDTGLPRFAGTTWRLRTVLLSGLDGFWSATPSANAMQPPANLVLAPPADAVPLFQALELDLQVVDDTAKKAAEKAARLARLGDTRIKKELPPSYTGAFAFDRPRTEDAIVGNEFACALRDVNGGRETDPKPDTTLTWGKVIAFALRQPELARALGLIYRDLSVAVDDVGQLKDGGWIYVELDPTAPGQITPTSGTVKSYAARLPPLDAGRRQLFGAVLFPVGQASQAGYDDPLAEAAVYGDGFAKLMHAFQPDSADAASSGHNQLKPATDCGIDLGWDDEQVVIWHNRQLEAARIRLGGTTMKPFVEAALGVAGYRIDVRREDGWHSLCRVHSVDGAGNSANLTFPPPPDAPVFSENFIGELNAEPAPVRNRNAARLTAWLPRYFTRWQGGSLVVNDDTLYRLTAGEPPKPKPGDPEKSRYAPDGPLVDLLYGELYEFRCRLADLSGGGPITDDDPKQPAPAPTTKLRFLRHVPPKALRLQTTPKAPDVGAATDAIRKIDKLSLQRPLMGYPEFVFAGVDRARILQGANNLLTKVKAAKDSGTAIGVADPDVAEVEVSVQVRLPVHDTGPAGALREGQFREIYKVQRRFPPYDFNRPLDDGPALEIALQYVDEPQIEALVAQVISRPLGQNDSLPLPRVRDVRLRLTPVCADTPNRFAEKAVRFGQTVDVMTRAPATQEARLFVPDQPEHQLNAIFLEQGPNLPQFVAQQLALAVKDLEFAAKPGRRVVFGASQALRHTLSGDGGVITFAAESEFLNHWLVVITLEVDRDWTWDGLADKSFEIARIDKFGAPAHVVGQIDLRFAINDLALAGDDAQFPDRRSKTRLIFFDAVDPNPLPDPGDPIPPPEKFPQVLHPAWVVRPQLEDLPAGDQDKTLDVRLPIAVAPKQMPKLKSAGIALTPYRHDGAYASTDPRRRALWLEFEEPVADQNDALFGRVLAYGPDPLLSGDVTRKLMPQQVVPGDFDSKIYARDNLPATQEPDPPVLPIDPEQIRVIVPNQPEDFSGLDSMVELTPGESGVHYIMPLPDVAPDAPELFGFWTYEFRVGHKKLWSKARERHGRPLRVAGVQHPAPALSCSVHRVLPTQGPGIVFEPPPRIVVTAPYATAIWADKKLTDAEAGDPRTRMWVMLYAQVMQADGSSWRNVLLGRKFAWPLFDRQRVEDIRRASTRDVIGRAEFDVHAVELVLAKLGLPVDAGLSVLAVELLPGDGYRQSITQSPWAPIWVIDTADAPEPPPADPFTPAFGPAVSAVSDPLGADLGTIRSRRILRTSPLTPVPPRC